MSPKVSCFFALRLVLLFLPTGFSLSSIPFVTPDELDGFLKSNDMENFMKHLRIPIEDLCRSRKDNKSHPMLNKDLPYGDILMERTEDNEETHKNDVEHDVSSGETRKVFPKPVKWPGGVVPYSISQYYISDLRELIESALKDMNSKLNHIHIRPYNNSDKNYVFIFSGFGCYSRLGMVGGQQSLSLDVEGCMLKRIVQHEMMHALGFPHEQNRPDRDQYVKVLYENIPRKWLPNYDLLKSDECFCNLTYDYWSVMQYPVWAPTSYGRPDPYRKALEVLNKSIDATKIGFAEELSEMDIQIVEAYYGKEK